MGFGAFTLLEMGIRVKYYCNTAIVDGTAPLRYWDGSEEIERRPFAIVECDRHGREADARDDNDEGMWRRMQTMEGLRLKYEILASDDCTLHKN